MLQCYKHKTTVNSYSCISNGMYLIIIINQSVLRQTLDLFQLLVSRQCYLVLPLSISSNFFFPQGDPVTANVFFLVFLSLL